LHIKITNTEGDAYRGSGPLTIRGNTNPNSEAIIILQHSQGERIVSTVESDSKGMWNFSWGRKGTYDIFAISKEGKEGDCWTTSNTVNVNVTTTDPPQPLPKDQTGIVTMDDETRQGPDNDISMIFQRIIF